MALSTQYFLSRSTWWAIRTPPHSPKNSVRAIAASSHPHGCLLRITAAAGQVKNKIICAYPVPFLRLCGRMLPQPDAQAQTHLEQFIAAILLTHGKKRSK